MVKTNTKRKIMKAKIMLLLLASASQTGALAQDYPQTDETGQTVYYKIMSACPEYAAANLCIQDNTQNKTDYPYVLLEHDAEQRRQEWTLLEANAAENTYHLRNRMSFRYVSTEGSWVDDTYVHTYATRKVESDALTLRPIGNNQVTISYKENGDERLLAARKVGSLLPARGASLVDSPWAWRIVPTSDLTGIEELTTENAEKGTAVYDLSGRKLSDSMQEGKRLPHGVYIVNGKKIIK